MPRWVVEENKRMGENGKRLGRTGHIRSGWMAYLGGGGAIAVALIMILSPAATAASVGVVIHSYKGVVSPENSISQSGCGKALQPKKWHFALATGIGGEASKGLAASCKKQVAGVGQYSSASTYGGFEAGIVLPKIARTATTINASIEAKWSTTLTSSDGGSAACNNGLTTYSDNITEWEWNSFHNYAIQENDSSNGVWYNYSYNVASVPSPFNLNNTTYYYHDVSTSTFGFCEADAFTYAEVYGYLVDTTTNTETSASSNTVGSNGFLFETGVEVYNETDFGCGYYYEWDQGTSYGSNTSTCYSYNTTLTSYTYSYVPSYTFSSGTNNSVTWTNSSTVSGSIVFSGPFSTHDHYALLLEVFGDADAYNSWQHGSASWNFNMATLGNGMKLTSISIS